MERYIDAEDLKAVIRANDWSNPCVPDVVCVIIDRTPTANVAPKAEVERLQDETDRYKRYYFNHCFDELRANVEADVRADTVRKMQERLEKHFCHDPAFLGVEQRLIMAIIERIAKEMVV